MIRADSNTRRTSSGSAQAESVRALYDLGPDWHEWHRRYIDGRGTCVCGARRGRRRQIWFPTRAPARSAPAREQEHADAPAGGTVTPDRDAGQTVHTAIDPTLNHRTRHVTPPAGPRVRPVCTAALDRRPRRTTPYHVADYSQERSSPHSHPTVIAPHETKKPGAVTHVTLVIVPQTAGMPHTMIAHCHAAAHCDASAHCNAS